MSTTTTGGGPSARASPCQATPRTPSATARRAGRGSASAAGARAGGPSRTSRGTAAPGSGDGGGSARSAEMRRTGHTRRGGVKIVPKNPSPFAHFRTIDTRPLACRALHVHTLSCQTAYATRDSPPHCKQPQTARSKGRLNGPTVEQADAASWQGRPKQSPRLGGRKVPGAGLLRGPQ